MLLSSAMDNQTACHFIFVISYVFLKFLNVNIIQFSTGRGNKKDGHIRVNVFHIYLGKH